MPRIRVGLKRIVDDSYDIEIGENLFARLADDLANGLVEDATRFAVIADSAVSETYATKLLEELEVRSLRSDLFCVPRGERSKTRETKALMEDQLLDKGFRRDSCIIALGGGMISDLSGFIASTFCRGIPYINYSTTLLSAADASVGGKTAVNTPIATNLIGTFHQPRKVYIDLNTWRTLPVREFRSGLAETIKHACIADLNFFDYLETNMSRIIGADGLVLDSDVCEHIAINNCQIKYRVVEKDEKEVNLRQILNVGHTAGRALEVLSNYELLHGEAVAIGLAIECTLAHKLGYMTEAELARVRRLLVTAGFDITLPDYISSASLVAKMYTDKKVRNGKIRFAFLSGIGDVKQFDDGAYSIPVNETMIDDTLRQMKSTGK